jgi:O-antigen/teichoic acid export membrane protein
MNSGLDRVRLIFTAKPFDRSTAEGRSLERYRRATLSSVAALGARLLAVFVSIASVPLTLNYLGTERFGLWVTIGSLQLLLVFADLGLGNGLINMVSATDGRDEITETRRAISSAFFMLVAVAVVAATLALVALPRVDWAAAFNVRTPLAASEAPVAVATFVACFVVGLPAGVVIRIQTGLQQGFLNSIWSAVGSLGSFGGLLLVISVHGGLPWLTLVLFGGPLLAAILNSVVLALARPDLRPSWFLADRTTAMRLMRVGFYFFVLQLAVAVAYQTDVIVAARVVGPEAAAQYGIAYRLFMVAPVLVTMALATLWPAYGEAVTRGDTPWVRRTLARSIWVAAGLTMASSLALLVLQRPIIQAWVGGSVELPAGLTLGMATWAIVYAPFTAISMMLNGIGAIRFQAVVAGLMAVTSIVLSVALGSRFGVAGVIWGTVLAYVACSAVPTIVYLRRAIARLEPAVQPLGPPA